MSVRLYQGDCLDVLPTLAAESVDLVLADLPYGTTQAAWDCPIPLVPLWTEYKRLLKPGGAIVLTASQPFTSTLVLSNPKWFRCEWIWRKTRVTGWLDCKRKPLKTHESVLVFYPKQATYNPQMLSGAAHIRGPRANRVRTNVTYGVFVDGPSRAYSSDEYYPRSVLEFPSVLVPKHPNEKPVALGEYFIRTYSNPGAVVLDNTMGVASFGVAAINTDRAFIGIERDETYFQVAQQRITAAQVAYHQAPLEAIA